MAASKELTLADKLDPKVKETILAKAKAYFGEKTGQLTNTFDVLSVRGDTAIVLVNGGPRRMPLKDDKKA